MRSVLCIKWTKHIFILSALHLSYQLYTYPISSTLIGSVFFYMGVSYSSTNCPICTVYSQNQNIFNSAICLTKSGFVIQISYIFTMTSCMNQWWGCMVGYLVFIFCPILVQMTSSQHPSLFLKKNLTIFLITQWKCILYENL